MYGRGQVIELEISAFAFGGNADVTVPGLSGQISSTSTDGSCGVSRGLCPQSTPCCSQYGWCGSTDAYCVCLLVK